MKDKTKIIVLYILFALPIPVALLGCLGTAFWLLYAVLSHAHSLEIILAVSGFVIGAMYLLTYAYSLVKTKKAEKIIPKSFLPLLHCVIAAIFLFSLFPAGNYLSELRQDFGFNKNKFTVIKEKDTHGDFGGDGTYILILDCSKNKEKALENIRDWKSLPLSENLELEIYGGEKDGVTYGNSSEERDIPEIKNGFYKFKDRHGESKDPSDDSEFFNRHSPNYSLAIYDTDNDILYYYKSDT